MKNMFNLKHSKLMQTLFAGLFVGLLGGQLRAQTPELNEARRLIENEQYAQAISKLTTYLGANPKDERADYLMGRAYFLQEKYNEAGSWFSKGMGHSARYPMNFIGAGAVEAKRDNFDGAKIKLVEAESLNKDNDPAVLIGIAEAYMGYEGKDRKRLMEYLALAEVPLYRAQKLAPTDARSFVMMGRLYGLQNVDDLEQSSYENAIQRDAKQIEAFQRLGQLYKKQKKYTEAADMFQKALALNASYAPALREMSEMWFMAKQYDKAKEYMDKYLSIMGNDKSAKMRSCQFKYAGEQYDDAITCMEAMLQDTNSFLLKRLLGYAYVKKSAPDADKALGYLDQYFKEAPPKALLVSDFEMQGKAYNLKGMIAEAVACYEKAMAFSAESGEPRPELLLGIADLYKDKKDWTNRALYIEKFLSGETNYNLKENYNLGWSYFYSQNFAKADSVFRVMTEKKPEVIVGHAWRAKACAQLDPKSELGLAKPHYEKVRELIGTDETKKANNKADYESSLRYLGYYHTAIQKNCEIAVPIWNELLVLKPEDPAGLEGLKFCTK